MDWMPDWLTEWLTDWWTEWLPDWLTDWLTDWLMDWTTDWVCVRGPLIYWLTGRWLTDLSRELKTKKTISCTILIGLGCWFWLTAWQAKRQIERQLNGQIEIQIDKLLELLELQWNRQLIGIHLLINLIFIRSLSRYSCAGIVLSTNGLILAEYISCLGVILQLNLLKWPP